MCVQKCTNTTKQEQNAHFIIGYINMLKNVILKVGQNKKLKIRGYFKCSFSFFSVLQTDTVRFMTQV